MLIATVATVAAAVVAAAGLAKKSYWTANALSLTKALSIFSSKARTSWHKYMYYMELKPKSLTEEPITEFLRQFEWNVKSLMNVNSQ